MFSNIALIGPRARARGVVLLSAFLLAIGTLGFSERAQAQLTGVRTIPGDYPDLATAIADLNAVGVGAGGVTLSLQSGNPQTAPAGGYTLTATGTAGNPIVLEGNGNTITASAAHTVGSLHDAVFELLGSDFVTIQNFVIAENAANVVTAAATNTMTEFGVALFYASATDGAQDNRLLGNTISLNRTYQNSFGIYSNSTHSATAVTTTATATGAGGGNSRLTVHANQISNVNIGIVVVGPTAAADQNDTLDIGGNTPATGNTLTNYGTTGTFSSYANVSGTVNGILVRNTRGFNISNNSITSSAGGVTAGTLRAIFVPAGSATPTGGFTNTIADNDIALRSGFNTGALQGIQVDSGANSAASTQIISGNTFTALTHTSATPTAAITGIQLAGSAANGPLVTNINGNTFDAISAGTTGNFVFISNNFTRPANGTITVNNNSISGSFSKTGAGGTVAFYTNNSSSPTTVLETNSGNNFSNVTVFGATAVNGWASTDGATPGSRKLVTNNTFTNLVGGSGNIQMLVVSFSDSGFAGNDVSGNVIHSVTGGGQVVGLGTTSQNQNLTGNLVHSLSTSGNANVVGILVSNGTTQNVIGNTVHSLNGSGTGTVVGIQVLGSTTANLIGNKVYDLESVNATGQVNGISVAATTSQLTNNVVGDLRAPNQAALNSLIGINLPGGTNHFLSYNTVRLAASSVGANFGTSALNVVSSANLTLRNNVLVNLSTPAGAGLTAAYRRTTTALASYQAASNHNDFFVPAGAGNVIFSDGTNVDATMGAYQARVSPRDELSFSENPNFVSTVGGSAQFLDIDPTIATRLESGAVPIAGITTDFNGATRDASTPDVGAYEFAGVLLDLAPPSISYAPLGNTTLLGNRVLTANITDATGVAGGALGPRVYFRKNADPYVSSGCSGAGPAYACTIDHALVGGVTTGDTVNYFVIAQDTAGAVNVGANPGAGLVASDVNTITTPPSTPNGYTLIPAFPASVNVGTGEAFTSLTNPGGVFEAANSGVFASDVTVNITSDLAGETGAVALNPRNEEGVGGYRFTIRPVGAPRSISGGSGLLVRIAGSDRVVIDGALGTGDRSLTLNSTSVASGSAVVLIGSLGAGQGAQDVTIRNTIIQSGTKGTATVTSFGVFVGNNTGAAAGPDNDRFRFENNLVRRVSVGVQMVGDVAGLVDDAALVGNTFGDAVTVDSIGRRAILIGQTTGTLVGGNTITNVETSDPAISANNNAQGILVSTGTVNTQVLRNRIIGVRYASTGGYGGKGIDVNTGVGASNITIANNFIAGVSGDGWNDLTTDAIVGLRIGGTTGGVNVWNNSVNLGGSFAGNTSGTRTAAFFASGTTSALDVRNNLFVNALDNTVTATDLAYAVASNATTPALFTAIDHNDYFSSGPGAMLGSFNGADVADLSAWQTATAQDANSIAVDPLFVSADDLHLQLTPVPSPATAAGTTIAQVVDDIDGELRPLADPDMGADQALFNTAPSITALASSRTAGDSASTSIVATVTDAEDPATALSFAIDGGASATTNGVTVSALASDAGGNLSASVAAACGASTASFTLRATDTAGLFAEATLTVTVDPNQPPSLSYPASTGALFGQTFVVNAASGPSDSGSIASVAIQSLGTYAGAASVDSAGAVTLGPVTPVGSHVLTIRVTDNCGAMTDAPLALVVQPAATSTTLLSHTPDPSFNGESVTVSFSVVVQAPGSGTPTGDVTVSDGVDSCVADVAVGQCSLALGTSGTRTLTATYAGSASFSGSSDSDSHVVTPAADLSVDASVSTAQLGTGLIEYAVLVQNAGPDDVSAAQVSVAFDPAISGLIWSCAGSDGGSCAVSGSGNIDEAVDLPAGASVLFTVTGTVPVPLQDSLVSSASVAPPAGTTDPAPGNDVAQVTVDPPAIFGDGFESIMLLSETMDVPTQGGR